MRTTKTGPNRTDRLNAWIAALSPKTMRYISAFALFVCAVAIYTIIFAPLG